MNQETMRCKLAKKQNTCRKTVKHPARRQKLKDPKAVRNDKKTGGGERPKHTELKPTDAEPTPQKVKLTT